MPKRINFNKDKFIDAYQAKNEFGNIYTIQDLARIFKVSDWSVKKYAKQFGLSRNKRRNNND
jgi:hypothetical protein